MKYKEIIYYQNELEDEIIDFKIKKKEINEKYKYIHKTPFYKILSFITYRLIAFPIFFSYFKIFKRIKYINKKVLKKYKNTGYFVYSNHTDKLSDGISPSLICFPKKPYIIVNSDNVSIPILGRLTPMWGALPLPDTLSSAKNFNNAIKLLSKKNPIIIYPEAHLWPYYTKIRTFKETSFKYPIRENKPVFTFTMVYNKPKHFKKPVQKIYIDGPFFPDKSLNELEQTINLRNLVYNKMNERASLSDYEYLTYIKRSEND